MSAKQPSCQPGSPRGRPGRQPEAAWEPSAPVGDIATHRTAPSSTNRPEGRIKRNATTASRIITLAICEAFVALPSHFSTKLNEVP